MSLIKRFASEKKVTLRSIPSESQGLVQITLGEQNKLMEEAMSRLKAVLVAEDLD